MTQYAEKNGLENGDALIEYAYALATKYGEAAASLACQMYDQTAAAAHKTVKPAEPADTATYPETAAAVNGTLKQSVLPQSVGNSVGRLVKQAASDTTLKNARRDHAQFAWIPSGDGCAYCQMIAANGWRNASKEVAEGDHADHIHPNCQCEFAVRFSDDDGVAGYDPQAYKEKYDNADGDTAKEKLRSMEREYREEHKDEINTRKREVYAEKLDMMAKSGSPRSNDWSNTIPNNYSKDEIKTITEEIKNDGIGYIDISKFDGDTELLKSSANTLTELAKAYPIKKKTNLLISELSDDDFGMTTSSGQTITINTKALRNREETEKNIQSDPGYFASKTVEDIAAHEYGHVYQNSNNFNTVDALKEAYYNFYGSSPTPDELIECMQKNVSKYSVSKKSEMVAEIFAKNNAGGNAFTSECMKVFREKGAK